MTQTTHYHCDFFPVAIQLLNKNPPRMSIIPSPRCSVITQEQFPMSGHFSPLSICTILVNFHRSDQQFLFLTCFQVTGLFCICEVCTSLFAYLAYHSFAHCMQIFQNISAHFPISVLDSLYILQWCGSAKWLVILPSSSCLAPNHNQFWYVCTNWLFWVIV